MTEGKDGSRKLDSQSIWVQCTKCDRPNRFKGQFQGKTGRCGKCGTKIRIPLQGHTPSEIPQIAQPPLNRASRTWFLMINLQRFGPYNGDEILQFMTENRITTDTFVWKEGMKEWQRVGDLFKLVSSKVVSQSTEGAASAGETRGGEAFDSLSTEAQIELLKAAITISMIHPNPFHDNLVQSVVHARNREGFTNSQAACERAVHISSTLHSRFVTEGMKGAFVNEDDYVQVSLRVAAEEHLPQSVVAGAGILWIGLVRATLDRNENGSKHFEFAVRSFLERRDPETVWRALATDYPPKAVEGILVLAVTCVRDQLGRSRA